MLKQGDTFAVFDRFDDIETFDTGELDLYYQETRFCRAANVRSGSDSLRLPTSSVFAGNVIHRPKRDISAVLLDARQQSSPQRNFHCSVDTGKSRHL
jgi:hypothetical protein